MNGYLVPALLALLLLPCSFFQGPSGTDQGLPGTATGSGGLFDEATAASGDRAADMLQLCLGFEDARWRGLCAAVFNKDLEMCEAQREYGYAERCGAYVAAVSQDPSICESVHPTITRYGNDGKPFDSGSPSDCYDYVASMTADKSVCAKASSQSGCEYRVSIWQDTLPLGECKESEALFAYAFRHDSTEACDRFPEVLSADYLSSKDRCYALVKGDDSYCKSIGDVDAKYSCIAMSRYHDAMPSPGVFEPDRCGTNTDCQREVLLYMMRYASTG